MTEEQAVPVDSEDASTLENWDYDYCAAFDIIPLDPPQGGSSHRIESMLVEVSSANQPYINRLFRMKPRDYSNDIVFVSDGDKHNAVRELVRQVGTAENKERQDAALGLAKRLATATPSHAPRGLFVILVGKHGNHQRVALWRFPNQDTLSVVRKDNRFLFSVTKTFQGQESETFKAAVFDGSASKASMWNGRIKDMQTANRTLDVAKYWMEKFLQCQRKLRPDYATHLACQALKKLVDKAASEEERAQIDASVIVLRAQDGQLTTMNKLADTLPEARREGFLKSLRLPNDQLDREFAISAAQVDAQYRYRVIGMEGGITLKAKREAFEDDRIKMEKTTDGKDKVTILGRIIKDKPQTG